MDCERIRESLHAHSEGLLPKDEKALIEEHLSACPKCAEMLPDLKKMGEYLRDLEDVEPPQWLSRKVMAKIRQEAQPKKGILHKLFYPLHVKLPLEALATVLIAVTAVYVFRGAQPEIKIAQAPSDTVSPQILLKEEGSVKKEPSDKPARMQAGKSTSEKKLSDDHSKPPSPPLAKGGEGGFVTGRPATEKETKTVGKFAETPKPAAPSQAMPSAGSAAKDEMQREEPVKALRFKTMSEAKEKALSVNLLVKDIDLVRKDIEKIIVRLGGRITKSELSEDSIILSIDLPPSKTRELFEKLGAVGEIKEKDLEIDKGRGEIRLIVEKRK